MYTADNCITQKTTTYDKMLTQSYGVSFVTISVFIKLNTCIELYLCEYILVLAQEVSVAGATIQAVDWQRC